MSVYPSMRYQPDGRTMIVRSEDEDDLAAKNGWTNKAVAATESIPEKREDLQAQVDDLSKRLASIEQYISASVKTEVGTSAPTQALPSEDVSAQKRKKGV